MRELNSLRGQVGIANITVSLSVRVGVDLTTGRNACVTGGATLGFWPGYVFLNAYPLFGTIAPCFARADLMFARGTRSGVEPLLADKAAVGVPR